MPQSMTQLPKEADFNIDGWWVTINNHQISKYVSLWLKIINISQSPRSDKNTLYQFEKHGVSFEAAIEWCATEFEENADVLADVIYWHYGIQKVRENTVGSQFNLFSAFSESKAGRKIAVQYIEKIRCCNNWEELYEEMQMTSRFHEDMKSRIKVEVKEQCRKV